MSVQRSAICLAVAFCVQGMSVQDPPPNPVPKPGPYDEEEAKMMASLTQVTYCVDDQQVLDWSCQACKDSKTPMAPGKVRIVDAGSFNATRVIISKLRDQHGCLMAFRGSSNLFNWIRDFQVWSVAPAKFGDCQGCKVHSGFYKIWSHVEDNVMRSLREVGCEADGEDNLIYVTGHSLGAALSHIAMFALKFAGFDVAKTYTFEGPRVGNKAFAEAFSNAFSRRFPVFRITHHYDPVVHVPPEAMGYRHVEKEVFYDGDGNFTVCTEIEDHSCSNRYWDIPALVLFHSGDHCASPLLANGDICRPVGCDDSSRQVMV